MGRVLQWCARLLQSRLSLDNFPPSFEGWSHTQTAGGVPAKIRLTSRGSRLVFAIAPPHAHLPGWSQVSNSTLAYLGQKRTAMCIWSRIVTEDETVALLQATWTATLSVWPPQARVDHRVILPPPMRPLERLRHNHPGLVVDLGVGLWACPLLMDFDGDEDFDLVVNCPDNPLNGVGFFENSTGDTSHSATPVSRPPRCISRGMQNVQVSYVNGRPHVLTPATESVDFVCTGLDHGTALPRPVNIYPNRVRANMWRYTDFNDDDTLDLIVGVDDWTEYGWDNPYSARGQSTNGPLRGFVYLIRNVGTSDTPRWQFPVRLLAGDSPIEVFGWPSPNFGDFDGDRDLDLICGEFPDGFIWFRNTASGQAPQFESGIRLLAEDGYPLQMNLQMITPVVIDWDRDGDFDRIYGDENGRVAFIEHTGRRTAGAMPIYRQLLYFRQEAGLPNFGAMATPMGFDWDGDVDLLCSNTAGYIGFLENWSGPGVEHPRWAAPRLFGAAGHTIRIQTGPHGSI